MVAKHGLHSVALEEKRVIGESGFVVYRHNFDLTIFVVPVRDDDLAIDRVKKEGILVALNKRRQVNRMNLN